MHAQCPPRQCMHCLSPEKAVRTDAARRQRRLDRVIVRRQGPDTLRWHSVLDKWRHLPVPGTKLWHCIHRGSISMHAGHALPSSSKHHEQGWSHVGTSYVEVASAVHFQHSGLPPRGLQAIVRGEGDLQGGHSCQWCKVLPLIGGSFRRVPWCTSMGSPLLYAMPAVSGCGCPTTACGASVGHTLHRQPPSSDSRQVVLLGAFHHHSNARVPSQRSKEGWLHTLPKLTNPAAHKPCCAHSSTSARGKALQAAHQPIIRAKNARHKACARVCVQA